MQFQPCIYPCTSHRNVKNLMNYRNDSCIKLEMGRNGHGREDGELVLARVTFPRAGPRWKVLILGTYNLNIQGLSKPWGKKGKANAFKKAKSEIIIFFSKNLGFQKNLPYFFAFFKNSGSISPRIAIIISTSRPSISLSWILHLLPLPSLPSLPSFLRFF